ncbi:MAG: arylsulfotransferase family protein [Conexibacteraceae bacterium]|nr:arylsulfotransferase family protein [Conexibacteraceae bacterium]
MHHRRFLRSGGAAIAALAATAIVAAPTALASTTAAAPAAAATTPTAPPPVTVLSQTGNLGNRDIFITPTGDTSTYANGPEILSPSGKVVWFDPLPAGQTPGDFRTQTYDGRPVLTFWSGTGFGGLSSGTDYIYNDHYQQIATVNAGNGLSADGHEFLITPWNTALILAYQKSTANLTSIGGPADQTVLNGVVQEIDIRTGKVLFQWNSADHVPYSESEQPLPASASSPWDWFHINAVKVDSNGDFLIDSRATWTAFEVDPRTGRTVWQLGGKDSSFTLKAAPGQTLNTAGDIFAWQHDPEPLGHGIYSLFDNESAGEFNLGIDVSSEFPVSRVVKVKLDLRDHTATLLQSYDQPESLEASSQGDGQPLPHGGVFVGWGNLPYISDFSGDGRLLFNAEFPAGVNSYRAYLQHWTH